MAEDDGRDGHSDARSERVTKVLVEPIGVTVLVPDGHTLLDAVTSAAVSVPTDCHGRGACGKCLVRLGTGAVTPPTSVEESRLTAAQLAEGWRLACQASPLGESVSIEVRETRGRRQILTTSRLRHGAFRPAVTRELVELPPADLQDARSDDDRLRRAVPQAEIPLSVIRRLPSELRDDGWRVLVTRAGRRVIDVEPADSPAGVYGAAVDIGTSKIIVYLFDLTAGRTIDQEALENPQMRFGEDVVTRITQALGGHLDELARAVRDGLNQALGQLYERQEIAPRNLYEMTVVANTAMHHLALGVLPRGLAGAPFAPAVDRPLDLRAGELGLAMNPEGTVHFISPIAGFVGSDALAVAAATRLASRRAPCMAVDIGTNTEISVAAGGTIVTTSCASGPAFEGYQITCGMKAVEGAIERASISARGEVIAIATIGGSEPRGICGSGVVDILAGLVRAGVVDRSGRMRPHPRVRTGRLGLEYLVVSGGEGDVVFTQQDVRALQLAKAAIAAGWTLLLRRVGLEPTDLHQVFVAGAFGNYLDVHHSLAIGLLPVLPAGRITFVGNAAGVGAQMALIDVRERRRIAKLRSRIEFLELATHKDFLAEFAARLRFD